MKALFQWLRRKVSRLSPLESAVLESVIAALPVAEGLTLRAQLHSCSFERGWGHKSLSFFLPDGTAAPALERLRERGRVNLAVVKVQGLTSRFSTAATVVVFVGQLAEIHFDPIPWQSSEKYLVECQLVGLPTKTPDLTEEADRAGPEPPERHRS